MVWAVEACLLSLRSLVNTYPCDFSLGGAASEVQEGSLAQTVVKATETSCGGLFQDGSSLQSAQASIRPFPLSLW